MKYLAALLLVLAVSAYAIEAVGDKVTLTDEDRETLKNCAAQGGCKVWTQDEIRMLLAIFYQKVLDSGAGCRRNSI